MLLTGSLDGDLDNERVEYADGTLFVLRRRQDWPFDYAQLWRMNPDGSQPTFLHEIDGRPTSLAANATHVYYSAGGTGIWRLPINAAPGDTAEEVSAVGALSIEATDELLFSVGTTGGSELFRADLDGGNPQSRRTSDNQMLHLQEYGGDLYYSEFLEGLFRLEQGSADPMKLDPVSTDEAHAFAIVDPSIYYVTFFGRVASMNLDGSNHQLYGPTNPNHQAQDALQTGGWFYWGTRATGVRRISISTSTIEEFADLDGTVSLATDNVHVFTASRGRVWSIPVCLAGTPL